MGLGMGATMMPIMSAALATLTDHSIARGSTLMNITQQVASSIGFALFSVLLTNGVQDAMAAPPTRPPRASRAPSPTPRGRGLLVARCLVPASSCHAARSPWSTRPRWCTRRHRPPGAYRLVAATSRHLVTEEKSRLSAQAGPQASTASASCGNTSVAPACRSA